MSRLFHWFAAWPLWLLHAVGTGLGWLTYWGSPTYRRRFRDQVRSAGVPWARARGGIASAGHMLAELPWMWLRKDSDRLEGLVEWRGAELVQAALDAGRGLVLLTPHLGCFEMCAQAYAERFGAIKPITVLFRPARQAWLREVVDASRRRQWLDTAPATLAGVRLMIRALRKGETVGLLPDQVPPEGLGVWAPFFGRSAYTMTLASRLVQQTGAAWLLMHCERLPGGRGYVLHVHAPPEALPAAPAAGTPKPDEATAESRAVDSATVINRAMEHLIRLCPEQYLWGYHRYKAPRSLDPSGLAGD